MQPVQSKLPQFALLYITLESNEGKSAASLCHQVAALVPDMFHNFYFVKNHKIANNSATTEATEKISAYSESLEFYNFLMCVGLKPTTIKFY
jgi:hypothetical protein